MPYIGRLTRHEQVVDIFTIFVAKVTIYVEDVVFVKTVISSMKSFHISNMILSSVHYCIMRIITHVTRYTYHIV